MQKKGHPASCRVSLANRLRGCTERLLGSLPYCSLYLSGVGFDKDFEYVVGGRCRRVGIVEPIVEFTLLQVASPPPFCGLPLVHPMRMNKEIAPRRRKVLLYFLPRQ